MDLQKGLMEYIDKNRKQVFCCVGTSRHLIDSIAPRIGSKLEKLGYYVIGTEEHNLHALNIEQRYAEEINVLGKSKYQVIGIDVMITPDIGKFHVEPHPIRPGHAIQKVLPEIGEFSIMIASHAPFGDFVGMTSLLCTMLFNQFREPYPEAINFNYDMQKKQLDKNIELFTPEVNAICDTVVQAITETVPNSLNETII